MKTRLLTSVRLLTLGLLAASTVAAGAAELGRSQNLCGDIFVTPSAARLAHLESIYAFETLNPLETRTLFEAQARSRVSLDDLYARYRELLNWTRFPRAMVVSNAALIRLAAVSVEKRVSFAKLTETLDVAIVQVNARSGENRKLTVSHNVHARLVETAIAAGEPIGFVVSRFNENVAELLTQEPKSLFLAGAPVADALAATVREFTPEN